MNSCVTRRSLDVTSRVRFACEKVKDQSMSFCWRGFEVDRVFQMRFASDIPVRHACIFPHFCCKSVTLQINSVHDVIRARSVYIDVIFLNMFSEFLHREQLQKGFRSRNCVQNCVSPYHEYQPMGWKCGVCLAGRYFSHMMLTSLNLTFWSIKTSASLSVLLQRCCVFHLP